MHGLVPIAVVLLSARYEVGPGQPLANLGDVPWESLMPGDEVLVHARPAAYAEKFVVNRQGVTVRGVRDAANNLPVLTGRNATTRSGLQFPNPDRAIVQIEAAAADGIILEDLHFKTARRGDPFTLGDGTPAIFSAGAGAVFVGQGRHVTVRRCIIEDFEKGVHLGAGSQDAVIERNVFRGNGRGGGEGGTANLELEGLRTTVQFNALLSPPAGTQAENVRDNSAGAVFAYNFIVGGNRVLDIDGIGAPTSAPEYARTRVFGNVLIKSAEGGNNALIQFGTTAGSRTLELYANTIVARRPAMRVVNLGMTGLTVKLVNNLVSGPAASTLVLADGDGTVEYGGNWRRTGTQLTQSTTTLSDLGGNREGDDPGFRDEAGDDFRLEKDAPPIDQALALPMGLEPPVFEFRAPADGSPRGDDGKPDIGAFEETAAVLLPDAGTRGLVGWRLQCGAAPGPMLLGVCLLLLRRRRGVES